MANNDWRSYAINEYINNERSFHSIGRELGKNPNTIRRALIAAGYEPRSKSQAQKIVIERDGPPIDRPRTEAEKKAISKGHQRRLDGMSDYELQLYKEKLSQRAKEQWAKLDDKEREEILAPMRAAARQSAGRGSKAENHIAKLLSKKGYVVEQRSKKYTDPYEIDILLLDKRIAIECDGPTHFDPIYGELALQKTQTRDGIKNAFMTAVGLNVIRVRDHTSSFSRAACRRAVSEIEKTINKIESSKGRAKVWTLNMN